MKQITLRFVTMADCEDIYSWRNSEAVREASIQSNEISYEEHSAWFARTLQRNDIFFLIAEIEDKASLGTLRFDVKDNIAEISIYLTPQYIGKGYGLALLQEGEHWLKSNHPKITTIEAKILAKNKRSLKTFLNAGFNEYLSVFRKELTNE
jgi:UDP-2,4-diacetamido-2,4,6-trideoxy-beta-L-altropyranose hydrolase